MLAIVLIIVIASISKSLYDDRTATTQLLDTTTAPQKRFMAGKMGDSNIKRVEFSLN